MEVKLRSAMPRLKTPFDMIDRPISFILFAIIVLVLAVHLRTLIKEYRRNRPRRSRFTRQPNKVAPWTRPKLTRFVRNPFRPFRT